MSEQLLKRVGEYLYDDQWQAPLARDISVGERTMRRWAAGTDKIPNGVWRDIYFRLESRAGDLEYLMGEVTRVSQLVEIYSFSVWDHAAGESKLVPRKSTIARIERIGGEIIPGTAELVAPSEIDAEGRHSVVERKQTVTKEKKAAKELADMIAAGINVGGVHVAVNKDPAYGWHPTVVTAPAKAYNCQLLAEEIAKELRAKYDLKE